MDPLIFKTVSHLSLGYTVVFYYMSEGRLYRWLNQEHPDNGLRWTQVGFIDVMSSDITVSNRLEFLVVTGVGWMRAMDLLRWAKVVHIFEGRDRRINEV